MDGDVVSDGSSGSPGRISSILSPVHPAPEDRLRSPLPGIVLFLFLLAVAALSVLLMRPPAPLPADAPADQFSATRALPHVQGVATTAHPVGSPAHSDTLAYLVAQLEQLGLAPQVQKATAIRGQQVASVGNVLARLVGSGGGSKAVLLVAHYDSVPTGPGASDDAANVAALLETARALRAGGPPLANDVIFLFSDGEEVDLMGAAAFVAEHPWAKDVGLVLNFEYRGHSGPSYTYETSPDNNWLISQYARAAPNPLASSLMYEVYRRMPNDSDFTVFKNAGYSGLNFAAIGGSAYYHTALDNLANVDLSSLQHQGSYAVSLVRHFGDVDLAAAHEGDAVYFDALGSHLFVHYSGRWVVPLVILAGLVWVGALLFGLRGKQASVRGVLLGTLASLLVVAVLAGLTYLLWRLVLLAYPQYDTGGYGLGVDTYNGVYYWAAFLALGLGLAALLHSGLRTRIRTADLALGGLLMWLLLAVAVSAILPGGSYVFTWPLLFSSLGVWGWLVLRRRRQAATWSRTACLAVSAIPAVALIAPLIYMFYVALSIQQVWIPIAVLGLLVGLLALPLAMIARPYKAWLPALMGLVVVGFLVAGHLTSDHTAARPLQNGVFYGVSADEGKAYWVGTYYTNELDVWTDQFLEADDREGDLRDIFPWVSRPVHKTPAPMIDLPAPEVVEVDEAAAGVFHLHVVPSPGTSVTYVYTMPDRTPVTYYVDGEPIESDGWLAYWAPPPEGFDLAVEAPALDSLTLRVVDQTFGLPTLPDFSYAPRPDWIIPDMDWVNDSTVVAKTFSF